MTATGAAAPGPAATDPAAATVPTRPAGRTDATERTFSISILISAIRCTLTYVVLPFVTPIIGLAPGVGPALGVVIGTVAIVANVYSIRRFWRAGHRWRKPVTVIQGGIIVLLVVLVAIDLADLLG